jgi:ribosome maturation factor RimP
MKLKDRIGTYIKLDLSGNKLLTGILIDVGTDLWIIYNGSDYLYIPTVHIQNWKFPKQDEIDEVITLSDDHNPIFNHNDEISLRKTLTAAKGIFTEIYVTSKQALHGYIISIMNNYFVFYSPVYKTMFISLNHLKWLIPYTKNQRPYGLSNANLPVNPTNITFARSFEVQIDKLVGQLIVFNIGENENLMGKIQGIKNNFVELITAKEEPVYLNLQHIKTVHLT